MAARIRTKRPVQMRDVAERSGVSISTVSHILNNTRPVAPETRERVLSVIQELNYHKNVIGRRLARGRSDSFGLIISDVENPFFGELIKSFEAAVQESAFDVLLCATYYDAAKGCKAVERMIENQVQGVAVMTSQIDPALIDELVSMEIPVVRLDGGEAGSLKSSIRVDYSAGALEALTHLRDLGHGRIGLISGPLSRVSAVIFKKVMCDAAEKLGLPPLACVEGNNDTTGGEAGVRALLSSHDPTAIVCSNDLAALGAVRGLVEAGLRVPDDVSVIGSDDISLARFGTPALTTIRIPRDELGRMACAALERMTRTKRHNGRELSIQTHLIVRESTGKAREGERAAATA